MLISSVFTEIIISCTFINFDVNSNGRLAWLVGLFNKPSYMANNSEP